MMLPLKGFSQAFESVVYLVLVVSLSTAAVAETHDKKDKEEEEPSLTVKERIEITDRGQSMVGVATSAAEGSVGLAELERRPTLRNGEVLETVPGLVVTQHSGPGKANQYFLRGFNLDHGTDFRVEVGGMQVNNATHGHGQGYTDINFLIPELIETVEFRKGPYFADVGDFSAAGSTSIRYVKSLDQSIVELSGGSFGYGRALAAGSSTFAGGTFLGAVEFVQDDGPWERPDNSERHNFLLRYSQGDFSRSFSATLMGYDASWDSTDQVPRRAIESGLIDRLGLLEPDAGGETSRYSLSFDWQWGSESKLTQLNAHVLRYEMDLFSNFTYFLDNPVDGDEFQQVDERVALGLKLKHHWHQDWNGRRVNNLVGFDLRNDSIENGLFSTAGRQRLSTTRSDDVEQLSGGPYIQSTVEWTPWLKSTLGLRGDFYEADVDSNLAINSGSASDFIASPKLTLVLGPWSKTEFYVNAGAGFHSNDARGATIRVDPRTGEPLEALTPLVRAKGADVGLRTILVPGLQTTVSLFGLELDSELVFVGDAGTIEASRPSRRTGIEWNNFYVPRPGLSIDFDVTWARARFTDDDPSGDRIPGALERTIAAGISYDEGDIFASLRLRYFSAAPLIEDNSVRSASSSLVNARIGYRFDNGLSLALEGFNVFDEEDSDITYFYASRLPGEPADGIEDIHFHPAVSASARLTASWRF